MGVRHWKALPAEFCAALKRVEEERTLRESGARAAEKDLLRDKDYVRVDAERFCGKMVDLYLKHDFVFPGVSGECGPIRITIVYMKRPRAARIIPKTLEREIAYVLAGDFPEHGAGFLMRPERNETRSAVFARKFSNLYLLDWITAEGRHELDAVRAAYEMRKEKIARHVGVELAV